MEKTAKIKNLSINLIIKIKWTLCAFLISSLFNIGYAATYYVDGGISDDSGIGTQASPKKYIQSGLDLLNESGGDTLIIADGIYSSSKDRINEDHVPSGTSYTTIRAETDWGVTINYPFSLGGDNKSVNYIIVRGIRFVSPGGNVGGSSYVGHHAKFQKCAFVNSLSESYGSNLGLGTKFNPVTEYVLVEDCYVYGQGGRYKFQTQSVKKVIFRRVVARSDGGWGNPGGNPEAVLMTYNSEDVLWQNCIAIDCDLQYAYWQGAFYIANKDDASFPIKLKNITWTGCMAVNVRGHGFHSDINLAANNLRFENCALLYGSNPSYGIFTYSHDADLTITNCNVLNADRGIREDSSGGRPVVSNVIVMDSSRENISGNIDKSFFSSWKDGTSVDGSTFTDNPLSSGMKYPLRIEPGTALKTAGSGGGQIGAEIMYQMGVSGTIFGEPGYNTLTDLPLWPFPIEDQIRSDMRTEPSIGTRGFCADYDQFGKPMTLTRYIWQYLGNEIPAEIYGGSIGVPTVIITQPTISSIYSTSNNTVNMSGTATDDVSISNVTWSNSTTGNNGTAQGTTNWIIPNIPLQLGLNIITVTAQDSDGNTSTDTITITYSLPDTEVPTTPTSLIATAVSSSQIDLSWAASADNIGATGYKIYRDGIQITTISNTSYQDTGLSPSTTYLYTVSAYDAAGNESTKSSSVSATTLVPPLIQTVINIGDTWKYFKGTSNPGSGWKNVTFDDSSWLGGPTGIGYGDGDDVTVLSDMQNNYLTVYARRVFNISDPSTLTEMLLNIDYDDGFVAYINGNEVARANMTGTPNYNTPTSGWNEAGTPETFNLSSYIGYLISGINVLAIEVHNSDLGSSDLSLIPELDVGTSGSISDTFPPLPPQGVSLIVQ
jgi:hypothetical protein